MTTIACNLKEMACDSKCSHDLVGSGIYPTEKIYRIGRSLFGEAGDAAASAKLIRWIQNGKRPDEEPHFHRDERGEFIVLELSPEGIFVWDHSLVRTPVRLRHAAIGSGRKVALYCMQELKKTPEEAVHEAIKVDDGSGGPVQVFRLEE